jgi:hypothetical protein
MVGLLIAKHIETAPESRRQLEGSVPRQSGGLILTLYALQG